MGCVPPEHDFSIQRDNEHILIRIFQKGRLFTFPFLFTISRAIDLIKVTVPHQYFL